MKQALLGFYCYLLLAPSLSLAQGSTTDWERFEAKLADDRAAFRKKMNVRKTESSARSRRGGYVPPASSLNPRKKKVNLLEADKAFFEARCSSFMPVFESWSANKASNTSMAAEVTEGPPSLGRAWATKDFKSRVTNYASACRFYQSKGKKGFSFKEDREKRRRERLAKSAAASALLQKRTEQCDNEDIASCMILARRFDESGNHDRSALSATMACHWQRKKKLQTTGCDFANEQRKRVKVALRTKQAAAESKVQSTRFAASVDAELRQRKAARKTPDRPPVPRDRGTETELKKVERRCKKGQHHQCYRAARYKAARGQYKEAQRLAEKSCKLYFRKARSSRGSSYCVFAQSMGDVPSFAWWSGRNDTSEYMRPDNPEWTKIFCENKHADACRRLAENEALSRREGARRMPARALKWSSKACGHAVEQAVNVLDHCGYAVFIRSLGEGFETKKAARAELEACGTKQDCAAMLQRLGL